MIGRRFRSVIFTDVGNDASGVKEGGGSGSRGRGVGVEVES